MKINRISEHTWKILIPIHCIFILSVTYVCFSKFQISYLLSFFTGWILICGYGIAIGYHRYLSHRSFKINLFFEYLLAYLGCLGGQGSPVFWVGLHMGTHHPHSDTKKDVHSPIHGIFQSYMGWQIFLTSHATPLKPAAHMINNPYYKFLHKNYYTVFWLTLFLLFFISPVHAIYGLAFPIIISIHQENLINCLCHIPILGYRNFSTNDSSTNVPVLGLFCFGQGWHNNHHAHPKSATFSHAWYEIDITTPLIYLIKKN